MYGLGTRDDTAASGHSPTCFILHYAQSKMDGTRQLSGTKERSDFGLKGKEQN